MNSGFGRNALLTNTALILIGYIRGIFVHPSPCCKLLGRQTHDNILPELVLPLSRLSEPHERTTTKYQFGEIERDIKSMCQRRERCPCSRGRGRGRGIRKLGEECQHPLLVC
jgi:hypothetical protein